MSFILLLAILGIFQDQENPPSLSPGQRVQGVIQDGDQEVHTDSIGEEFSTPLLGRRYRLELPGEGTYSLGMRSLYFHAYLVLRSKDGRLVAENGEGYYWTPSAVVLHAQADEEPYYVDACALHGECGAFELVLVEGEVDGPSPEERTEVVLRDARERVRLLEEQGEGDRRPMAMALNDLALKLDYEGEEFKEAKALLERALEICEKLPDSDVPEAGYASGNLGLVLLENKRFEEAEPFLRRAIETWERIRGPDAYPSAMPLHNMGVLMSWLDRHEEALTFYERSLRIQEKANGPGGIGLALLLKHMAQSFEALGDYGQARKAYERVVGIQTEHLGPEHKKTIATLQKLAEMLHTHGDLEAARPLYERVLDARRKIYGPEHSYTAYALNNLAMLLGDQGDYAGAEALFEQALELYQNIRGPEHPDTAVILENLGDVSFKQKKLEEAQRYYDWALHIREAAGFDTPSMVPLLNGLSVVYTWQKEYEKARSLLERAVSICRIAEGADGPSMAACFYNLALLYEGEGDFGTARLVYERALALAMRRTPNHPSTASILLGLGRLLEREGDFDGALSCYRKAHAIREAALGPAHPETKDSAERLAGLALKMAATTPRDRRD